MPEVVLLVGTTDPSLLKPADARHHVERPAMQVGLLEIGGDFLRRFQVRIAIPQRLVLLRECQDRNAGCDDDESD